ncbi:MAG: transglutaminase family protein [Sphingomonadales bacterium]|nr:MAG: transglutaminase family protein [Sphingomonadales bacterium]
MRIAIEHHTHYRFSEPQARLVQMLRLTPCDTQDQTVVSWHIGVDCDARLRDAIDGYGNAITMLYAEGPIAAIDITVTGEVLTNEATGVVRDAVEPLPPLFYRRVTARTLADIDLIDFAEESAGRGDPLDRMHRINTALHARFPRAPDRPDTGKSAVEAFAVIKTTSRDVAQMFIASARSLQIPARYISGYRSDGEASHSAPHAWAEAYIDRIGWIGFDPATGLSPDASYVRVAVGLDALGAASIAGMRVGQGKEELDVDLHVDRLGGEE